MPSKGPFIFVMIPFLLWSTNGHAQSLSLFEPVEVPPGANDVAFAAGTEQRALSNAPAFTLLGTSRIGSKRRVSLLDGAGQKIVVELGDTDSTPIPDHAGYRVVTVGADTVSISLPANAPCVGSQEKGVQCTADGRAELSLTTAAPLVLARPAEPAVAQQDDVADADQVPPDNPFAAALRAAAQNEANAQDGRGRRGIPVDRFEARRIAPEEVPPGMRVVRTPFGDRLVEL